jgi:REP element-mobilizing transposase RayT
MPINRKITRLTTESYRAQRVHFVTICCDQREPHLDERAAAQSVLAILEECAAKHSFQLHAFCLMPDHVHILA